MNQNSDVVLQDHNSFSRMLDPLANRMPPFIRGFLGKLLEVRKLETLYRRIGSEDGCRIAPERLLDLLEISYNVSRPDLMRIPKTGPAVVVANHPFGVVEGLVLTSVLRSVRPDVKILANSILEPIEELRDFFIYVDSFGGLDAPHNNYRPLRQTMRWLEQGGILAVFPAGEVAHVQFNRASVTDPKWKDTTTRLARRLGIPAIPVYFCGTNSLAFHLLGLFHPKVRTAMLAREMLNKRRRTLEVRIGKPIPARRLKEFDTDSEATEYLRKRTFLMAHREGCTEDPERSGNSRASSPSIVPTADATDPDLLESEISRLPERNVLMQRGDLAAIHAGASEIPATLREIGRLRELTFREVGEGSGKALDLDAFDPYYRHIFLWDRRNRCVVGAYRIGRTDRILAESGLKGLYINSLFRLRGSFFRRLGPALELGRSFIRPENQKDSRSLPLLWTGIVRYVAKHPRYRYLYGPVSISGDYRPISRELIARFLRLRCPGNVRKFEINPVTPPSFSRFKAHSTLSYCKSARSLDDLSDFISDIEPDAKGVPVLLRHYIRLGAKTLAFNMDPNFGNCLDALVIIDLAGVDSVLLDRMMGKETSMEFRRSHHVAPRNVSCRIREN